MTSETTGQGHAVGPVVVPGRPCQHCFAHRLLDDRYGRPVTAKDGVTHLMVDVPPPSYTPCGLRFT